MKRTANIFLILFVAVMAADVRAEQNIKKTFPAKEELRIKLVLGECKIMPSKDGKIHVHVSYTYDDDEFNARMDERDDEVRLEEELYRPRGGSSDWTINVPDGMEIEFDAATGNLFVEGITAELEGNTGTGDIKLIRVSGEFDVNSGTGHVEAKDSSGEFELNSGTGRVTVEKCNGEFEANSGTGDVELDQVTFKGGSEVNSGTGDAEVCTPKGTDFDLSINSGTNDAVLDMAGVPLEGYFELTAHAHKGRIICPVEFDTDDDYRENGSQYVRRSFSRGKKNRRFSIETGTGKAVLKK